MRRGFGTVGWVYLFLAVVGLVLAWSYNLQFFREGGSLAPDSFFGAAFANPLTTAITLDVYMAAVVFSVWVVYEARKPDAPRPWTYVILCFAVGLMFAFPLYLAMRERRRDPARASSNEPGTS